MVTRTAQSSVLIPVASIHRNPDQPRTFFDENALDELATSIRSQGLLQPLVVRPHESQAGVCDAAYTSPHYVIVAGERRWRAAPRAGLEMVPCTVIADLNDEAAFIMSVTENVLRADMDIIEEAKAYQHIVSLGKTVEEVASLFGKTLEYIRWRLELLDLRDDIQHLVARGQISMGPGWYISRLSHDGQAEVLKKLNAGQFSTDDATCRYAAAVRMREESPELFRTEGGARSELEEARRAVHRNKLQTAWSKIEVMSAAFGPFLDASPVEIATAVEQDTQLYQLRLEVLLRTVRRALGQVRKAAALHDATKGGSDNGFPLAREDRRAVAEVGDEPEIVGGVRAIGATGSTGRRPGRRCPMCRAGLEHTHETRAARS